MRTILLVMAMASATATAGFMAFQAHAEAKQMQKAMQKVQPFTSKAFAAAQAKDMPILVSVHAPWCPVCRAQSPIVSAIAKDPKNSDMAVFQIDFDGQKAEQRPLKITGQSTLIAFRGRTETGRSQGVTDAKKIAELAATTRR